jgi:hypothetical protein
MMYYLILVVELRKDNRQDIGDHNLIFKEMNHWLNIFWHCEFSIITLDHNQPNERWNEACTGQRRVSDARWCT